jgi:hypothetical protein
VCETDSWAELRTHGRTGASELADLQIGSGFEQVGIGLGVVTHPPYAPMHLAGAIAPVFVPPPVPSPTPSEGDPDAPAPDPSVDPSVEPTP